MELLKILGPQTEKVSLIADRAYEGLPFRQRAFDLGYEIAISPKCSRTEMWEYDQDIYKKRNKTEGMFRRLRGYRRIFSRFD